MIKYHVGFLKDYKHPNRLRMQLCKDKDLLSCELWRYFGERVITKTEIRRKKNEILQWINNRHGTSFTRLIIE